MLDNNRDLQYDDIYTDVQACACIGMLLASLEFEERQDSMLYCIATG